mgnify:CR=1 FL=1
MKMCVKNIYMVFTLMLILIGCRTTGDPLTKNVTHPTWRGPINMIEDPINVTYSPATCHIFINTEIWYNTSSKKYKFNGKAEMDISKYKNGLLWLCEVTGDEGKVISKLETDVYGNNISSPQAIASMPGEIDTNSFRIEAFPEKPIRSLRVLHKTPLVLTIDGKTIDFSKREGLYIYTILQGYSFLSGREVLIGSTEFVAGPIKMRGYSVYDKLTGHRMLSRLFISTRLTDKKTMYTLINYSAIIESKEHQ